MSELIGIVGSSGSGKSTAIHKNEELGIKGLNPKETVVINVAGKPLPFRGWRKFYTKFTGKEGNYLATDNHLQIIKAFKFISDNRPEIKNIILDDMQYLLGFAFMNMALEKGYDRFTLIAKNFSDVILTAKSLRDDIKVFALTHSEEIRSDFDVTYKIKTIGKLVDDKLTPEGLFTTLLFTDTEWNEKDGKMSYRFITNRNDKYPAKSPYGMFDKIEIPNDLGLVAKTVDEYNNG